MLVFISLSLSLSLSLSVFSLFSFWKHEASFKDLTKGKGVVAEVAEGALLAGDKPEPQARLRGLQVKETAFPKLITLQHPSCFLFARPPEPVALQTIPCAPRSQRTRSVRFFGPRSSGPFVSSIGTARGEICRGSSETRGAKVGSFSLRRRPWGWMRWL